ncbi:NUDIX domain-containing protein [Bacillus oleivorans]|uniref:NUDIX domain-containing protein n=1 Tax=Bacillus oleivorans TaxID=1448271 RepID=A0A285CM75_9BACI|nr:NUDIX domain-containing protein [Bacillus oleivorans]SNX68631.1 NUDIX domain-containing protein [Bacillus oleivorans]
MASIFAKWGEHLVKLTWIPQMKITELTKVTSVHAVCMLDGYVMLVHIKNRGFNYPGGHVEPGEELEKAVLREAYEEGYVIGSIQYIGAIEVSHEENPAFDPNGKYPLIGYQAFYRMDITECHPFLRKHESVTRIWVETSEVQYVIHDHELSQFILAEALTLNMDKGVI